MQHLGLLYMSVIACFAFDISMMYAMEREQAIQVVGVRNASHKPILIQKTHESIFDRSESVSVKSKGNIVHPREVASSDMYIVNADAELDFFRTPITLSVCFPEATRQSLRIVTCGQDGGMVTWVIRARPTRMLQYQIDQLGRTFERGTLQDPTLSMDIVRDLKVVVDVLGEGSVAPLLLSLIQECPICCDRQAECVLGCCGYLICSTCLESVDKCPGCQVGQIDLLYVS